MNIIDKFLEYLKANEKSENTIKNYQSDLNSFAKWFLKANNEKLILDKITPTDLRLYKKQLIKNKKPKTINRHIASIKAFISWGVRTKKIKYNIPTPKNVKELKVGFKWLDRLEQNELQRKVEQTANKRNVAIIKILLNTGLRVNELCELTWDMITISERKGKIIVKLGKRDKTREMPLNKDCRNSFLSIGYTDNIGKESRIFKGQRGNLTPRGVQLMLKKIVKGSNLKNVTPHQLRHSFCKNLVDMGVGLEKVAFLAGHESLDITKIYCTPSFNDLQEAVELIGEEE
ncbi:tyrosine-type recombinase/integrase (plasmid) [Candidatus Bandiella numerosa]|uniref:tyrosine-type recombinase/integrase n=2 Tax=Candidatus Bandiella numerosa TaxID=2570586 RepID=UPI00249E0224|nr:tyrosine-type recombinase/integrase [Candidatus Bandiella numerosa]WHA05717.1 tyrosine-type recombinase/integrase [Candidatus Bandiella numerosa]WHA05720.1 tyrosine-type recombinase/integrase [Candidatus Bandiella numerosa]